MSRKNLIPLALVALIGVLSGSPAFAGSPAKLKEMYDNGTWFRTDDSINLTVSELEVTDGGRVHYSVKNGGLEETGGGFYIKAYVNEELKHSVLSPELDPGHEYSGHFQGFDAAHAEHGKVRVVADAYDDVHEACEVDNERTVFFTPPTPDLTVSIHWEWSNDPRDRGLFGEITRFRVYFKIRNTGPVPVTSAQPFQLRVYGWVHKFLDSDDIDETYTIDKTSAPGIILAPGESTRRYLPSFHYSNTVGVYAKVDKPWLQHETYAGDIPEVNEWNNEAYRRMDPY